jgi:hypothetical protein
MFFQSVKANSGYFLLCKDRREAYKSTLFAFTLSLALLPLKNTCKTFSHLFAKTSHATKFLFLLLFTLERIKNIIKKIN